LVPISKIHQNRIINLLYQACGSLFDRV